MPINSVHTPVEVIDRYCINTDLKVPLCKSISEKAVDYNIDPLFALATFNLETGYGESQLWIEQNNPAGILDNNGEYATFQSQEEGIEAMCSLIRIYCDDYGLLTVDDVRDLWSTAEDSELTAQLMVEAVKEAVDMGG